MGMGVIQYFFVGMGGFIGAISRYLLSSVVVKKWPNAYPFGTFTVNMLGSLLLGFFITINNNLSFANTNLNLAITIGFLGAFTTFSTFSYELIKLIEERKLLIALVYLIGSLLFGLLFVATGYWVGNLLHNF